MTTRSPFTRLTRVAFALLFCLALSSTASAQFQTANSGVTIDFQTIGIFSNNGNFSIASVSARLNNDGRVEVGGCIRSNAPGIGSATYSAQLQVIDGNTGQTLGTAVSFSQPLPGFQQDIPFNQRFFTPPSPVGAGANLELIFTFSVSDGNTFVLDTRGKPDGQFQSAPNPRAPGNYNWTVRRYAANNFPTRCGGFSSLPSCPDPSAASFGASPGTINQGDGSTLNWNVPGADSVTISGVGTFSGSSGSTVVSPSSTQTYTLSGQGAQDCTPVTLQTTVNVNGCQSLDGASVSASTINLGDSVTFTVNASNASGITLTDLSTGQVWNFSGNTLTVSPTNSTTFRVSVNGACAPVTQDFGVTVIQPPNIWIFFVNPNPICAGANTTLGWDTGGASAVSITDLLTGQVFSGLGTSGTLDVTPPSSRDYLLTASNGAGSVTRQVSLTVNPLPAINGFAPSPASIFNGQATRLNFSASNSTSQTITDLATGQVIDVTGLSFLDVAPNSTRTYRYTASGTCAPTSQDQTVTVTPVTGTISANPNPIVVCDGTGLGVTTISWSANVSPVQIRVGAPDGGLLANGAASGSAATGKWVSNGLVFYLQNAAFGDPTSAANTIATVTVGVTTAGCPAILSFSSNVGAVCPGGGAILSYNTQNVSSGNINGTPLPSLPSGTMTVFPTAPFSDYVLTVNGGPGGADTRTQTLRVTVNPTSSINSLSASPNPIAAGQSTRISFSSSNSTSQTLTDLVTNQVFNVTGLGFFDVTPPSTRSYRYTASGTCGSTSQDIQITVNPCQTGNMTASATTITQGSSVTFTTTTSGATSATVTDLTSGQVINVAVPSGTATFTPPATGTRTYRFTVNGACAAFTQDIQVTVVACQTGNMTASATTINQGGNVTFTTTASNASSATITDLSTNVVTNVAVPNGTATFTPSSSRTYRYTVNGACAAFTQDIAITVNPTPVIVSYTASAPSVCPGGSVVLSYTTQNVTSGNINGTPLPTLPNGTMTVFPTAPSSNYVMTVNGAGGQTATLTRTVTVNPTTSINNFTPSASTITLGGSVTFTTGAANANSGTVTDLTSGQVINVAVPNGTATFTPAATGTRTFRFTAAGTCNSPTQGVTITVNPAQPTFVWIGPSGQPKAVGPTNSNDDYTNMTMSGAAVAVPQGGTTTAGAVITFVNTVLNDSPNTNSLSLTARVVPAGFTVEASGDNVTWTNIGTGALSGTLAANTSINVFVRVTAPAGLSVLTGHAVVLRIAHTSTPTLFNETIDRLWTGYINAVKTQVVTNSTGVGAANQPVRGAVIEYVLTYSNVTAAAAGTGNVDLPATNLVLTENGSAAPNNWASTTTHVVGSASDSRGGTITGDTAGSSLLTDTIPSLPPAATGTFRFRRVIK